MFFKTTLTAAIFYVDSQREFDSAHDNAAMNDLIVWKSRTYSGIYMDISNDHIFITSETLGSTVFTGASRVNITGD